QQMGIVISWDVAARFTRGLDDSVLRAASKDLSIILKCAKDDAAVPQNLKRYRNKFVGHVSSIASSDAIVISARDGGSYTLPPSALVLEASPATMNALQQRLNVQFPTRRLQQLSHVLTKDGRRNSFVLRNRLDAIRNAISPQPTSDSLMVPLQVYGGGKLI